MDVYLESGAKRVFAGAIAWPGWCRSARGEDEALASLTEYGARYAAALKHADLRPVFVPPKKASTLRVVERLDGDGTTDFGAPSIAPAADDSPVEPSDLRKLRAIMEAAWAALDRAARAAAGVELKKGPRGGGRDLGGVLEHVMGAEVSYARKIAIRAPTPAGTSSSDPAHRAAVLDGLSRAVNEGVPASGPRGGVMWSPRYFIRRAAWHVLDHAWEIEDRSR
ncbi:MAG: hypothetical protein QOE83_2294 [Actinomycetota bacterium]|nr:hypothetical protein [Actinomycetota bacterium]